MLVVLRAPTTHSQVPRVNVGDEPNGGFRELPNDLVWDRVRLRPHRTFMLMCGPGLGCGLCCSPVGWPG